MADDNGNLSHFGFEAPRDKELTYEHDNAVYYSDDFKSEDEMRDFWIEKKYHE